MLRVGSLGLWDNKVGGLDMVQGITKLCPARNSIDLLRSFLGIALQGSELVGGNGTTMLVIALILIQIFKAFLVTHIISTLIALLVLE